MNNRKITIEETRKANQIYIFALLIVLVASAEAIMLGKSKELMDAFIALDPANNADGYIGVVLINFFQNIIEVVLTALYVFFTFKKHPFNSMFKIVFAIIIGLKLVTHILKFNLTSVFYYLLVILYILFLYVILTVPTKRKVNDGLR